MTAFDTAFALLKEYNPGWRYQARALPRLSDNDLTRISQQWLEDTGQTEPDYVGYEDYPSGQTMKYVLPHPDNHNFVVKLPRSVYSSITGEDKGDPWQDIFDVDNRFGAEYHGKNLIQELEDLGFPVVSEYNVDDRYFLQPWLARDDVGAASYREQNSNRPTKGVADIPLNHIVADRQNSNWGVDQTGNWRMFDIDMGLSEPTDYWPATADDPGEKLQTDLDRWGIEIPASRLLEFMSHIDHERPGMQNFLEAIEPHSANPNYLTIDGKPVWREGY